ncbi:MAG: hypothetical protein PVH24_02105 [Candidatus Zixiibacteriota bacterium]
MGDTVGTSGELNSVITVFLDNWDDDVFAFEMTLILERPGIMFFQTDTMTVIDTTYWICEDYNSVDSTCIDSIAGWPDTSWWKCIGYDSTVVDSCVDSVRTTESDPEAEWVQYPRWDFFYVDTQVVTVGSIDTAGTLIGGWEDVRTRSFTSDAIDVYIAARSNVNYADGHTPPPIPAGQNGGVLFRLQGDILNIPDSTTDRTVAINVRSSPADNFVFSRPNGTQIGLAYEPYIDTFFWRCEYWSGDSCQAWKKYSTYQEGDSLEIVTLQHPYIDTTYAGHIGQVVLDHGSLEVLSATCGDLGTTDDKINLNDITQLIAGIFLGGAKPIPECLGNVDCSADCKLTLNDITTLIDHVYISHNPLCEGCCSGCAK